VNETIDAICRPDFEAGLEDFKIRLANYEKVQSINFRLVTVQAWLHTFTCFFSLTPNIPCYRLMSQWKRVLTSKWLIWLVAMVGKYK